MNNYIIKDGELYHWGIKGQKWGKRRYQNPDGTLTPEGEKRYARKEALKGKRDDVKNRQTMSDQELRAKVNRLQMEKQLRELTDEECNRGRTATKKWMSRVGNKSYETAEKIVSNAAVGIAGYAISAWVDNGFKTKGYKSKWSNTEAAKTVLNQFKKK